MFFKCISCFRVHVLLLFREKFIEALVVVSITNIVLDGQSTSAIWRPLQYTQLSWHLEFTSLCIPVWIIINGKASLFPVITVHNINGLRAVFILYSSHSRNELTNTYLTGADPGFHERGGATFKIAELGRIFLLICWISNMLFASVASKKIFQHFLYVLTHFIVFLHNKNVNLGKLRGGARRARPPPGSAHDS